MRDRIEKAVLLLVLVNFAYEKNRVHHEAGNDEEEKYDAQDERNDFSPIEENPGDIQGQRQPNQASAQRHEKNNFLGTSGDAHRRSLYDHTKRAAREKKPRGEGPAAERSCSERSAFRVSG